MGLITTTEFLDIGAADDRGVRRMPVGSRSVGGGRGSLFGGVGLAAGIIALEDAAGKPAVWATGQYVSTLFPPAALDLDVTLSAVGRTVTQGRVVGTSDGNEIITVVGAVGRRREPARVIGETMPAVAAPEDCVDVGREFDGPTIHDHVEVRVARGTFGFTGVGELSGDNRTVLWTRFEGVGLDAAALAIMADYSPSALGNAIGGIAHLSSLDNTIRFGDLPTADDATDDWIMLDTRVEFVGNGFSHSTCVMWSRTGDVLAVASQSATVVILDDGA